jgi:two-component system invasion response regulator UvrY
VVRGGLRQFLANEADMRIVGEARSGTEALALVNSESWDLLLLDIALPDLNGIEVLKRVKRAKPGLPVLIFSMFAEDDYAMTALDAGASGYLPKDTEPERILDAIRRAGRGEIYLSTGLTEKLLAGNAGSGKMQPHDALSVREFEVMRLLSRGMALTAIGEALKLSPKTVSTYRARVMEKLALGNNVALTRYVIEHKLDAQAL